MKLTNGRLAEKIMCLIVCGLILLVFSKQGSAADSDGMERVTALSDGWYYLEDGKQVYITLPTRLCKEEGEELVLYYDGLTQEAAGQVLNTKGAVYRLRISLEEKELYRYSDAAFPRNVQMASKVNCTAQLPKDYAGGTVAFIYQNTAGGVYQLGEICLGSSSAMLIHQCAKDAVTLSTIFVMAILGVITVCIALYLKYMGVKEKRFVDIACFLLLCVCWFVTDSSIAQVFSGSSPVMLTVSFYSFMLLAVPMLHFVKDTVGMENYPAIDGIVYCFYANAAIQSLLKYLGIFEFVDMLFVTHLLLAGGITVVVILMLREHKKNGSRELLTILQAFTVVAGGGMIALILYWLLQISYYEVFFEAGIVVMIILLIRSLTDSIVQNLKFRTETMVYRRLANEDMLTGMKNRMAFEAFIAQLQENSVSCKDLFLIFMDINRLKDINDMMGHNVGDEVIIAAAGVIRKAFGQDGQCFRIGGNEFCAIVSGSGVSEEGLAARLDAEIRQYNKTCSRYQLSIARGISCLRDQRGELKTVSDWKKEADLKMYSDKGWIRARSEDNGL